MTAETVTFRQYNDPEQTASDIMYLFHEWNSFKEKQMELWSEIDKYIHATDNSDFNSDFDHNTFIPVVSEIHEDLQAILYSTIFPHNDWLGWQPFDMAATTKEKRKAVLSYIKHIHGMNGFKHTIRKVIDDFTRYGNSFVQVVHENEVQENEDGTSSVGYIGPSVRRISPYDIVFNPTASSFEKTPKLVKAMKSIGGFVEWTNRLRDRGIPINEEAVQKALEVRRGNSQSDTNTTHKNAQYQGGFNSIESYYIDGYIELLWFYGDVYDEETEQVYRNRLIVTVDGSNVLFNTEEKNPCIFKATWKSRPDNLWGQGALDNIIGMNYMVNHRENAKNDAIDRFIYPDRLYAGDIEEIFDENTNQVKYLTTEGGQVTDITPDTTVLSYDTQIEMHEQRCRRAARLPQQLAGFRTPGEKTATEVQTLHDGAFRGFINKAEQFEQELLESAVKAEILIAKENYSDVIRILAEDEDKLFSWVEVTEEDLKSNGKLVPFGSRRFSRMIQQQIGLQQIAATPLMELMRPHMNSWALSETFSYVHGFDEFDIFAKFAAIEEQVEQQEFTNLAQQELAASTEQRTPEELTTEDLDGVQGAPSPE